MNQEQTALAPAAAGAGEPAGRLPGGLVPAGLTTAQVRERIAAGQVNTVPAPPGRSVGQILRANVCTRFNAILGSLFGVVLVVGPPQDALFGVVLAANTAIGVAQELRARRTLGRLAVLTAAPAQVVRDGTAAELGVEEIVRDDLIILRPGDQAAVDAVVVRSEGLEADESLLTGEAEPPAQKLAAVRALQGAGHVVAMIGDGVNDVQALKQADLGIAMGSGSQASRSVARLVLLDSEFGVVPQILAEGRRVIANIERVARLFVTKTACAAVLALTIGIAGDTFPFFPRHLTIVSTLAIGVPGFFLALAAGAPRARDVFSLRLPPALATFGAFGAAAVAIGVLTLWRWTAARYQCGRRQPGGQ